MTFLHPEFIYLMMPILFILFYFLLTQADEMHHYFSAEVVDRLRVRSNRMSLRTRNVLFFLMFVLLVLALAFPVIEERKVKVQSKRTQLMVALDISASMRAEDVYPTRLRAAQEKVLSILDKVSSERTGVIAFAKESYLVAPMTFDHRAVRFLVRQLRPSLITQKGTDIMELLHATKAVMKDQTDIDLLIISDGGEARVFTQEIAYAKAHGITVYVLLVGTEQGAPIKDRTGSLVKANMVITHRNSAIADLATQSGGSLIESVTGERDVVAMMKEITGKSRGGTLDEEEVTQFIPLFYIPLGLAMLILIIATSSMSKRERLQMPGVFLLGWLLIPIDPVYAGLTDFKLLQEAKRLYESGEYAQSAKLYGTYANERKSDEARYDQANALYRSGHYEAAAKVYEKVAFADRDRRFDTFHNLGNAYARQHDIAALRKAVTSYERALRIKEERMTRENLDQVKMLIIRASSERRKSEKKASARPFSTSKMQESDKHARSDDTLAPSLPIVRSRDTMQDEGPHEQVKSGQKKERGQGVIEKDADEQMSHDRRDEQEDREPQHVKGQDVDKTAMSDIEERKWFRVLERQPFGHIYKIETLREEEPRDARPW